MRDTRNPNIEDLKRAVLRKRRLGGCGGFGLYTCANQIPACAQENIQSDYLGMSDSFSIHNLIVFVNSTDTKICIFTIILCKIVQNTTKKPA